MHLGYFTKLKKKTKNKQIKTHQMGLEWMTKGGGGDSGAAGMKACDRHGTTGSGDAFIVVETLASRNHIPT